MAASIGLLYQRVTPQKSTDKKTWFAGINVIGGLLFLEARFPGCRYLGVNSSERSSSSTGCS